MENITSSKLFTTRQGTILLGVAAAVLAAIALVVYLHQYRNSVNSKAQPLSVLVAKSLIQKGTPGDVVGSTDLYEVTSLPKSQVKTGAFVDPASLAGKIATADIYPGQQLTSSDFAVGSANALTQNLSRTQRAVVVPLDSPSEVGGQITAGDHVDIWVLLNAQTANGVSTPIVREVLQNMTVMTADTNGGNVTIRATPKQAGELIFASQEREDLAGAAAGGGLDDDEAARDQRQRPPRASAAPDRRQQMNDRIRVLVTSSPSTPIGGSSRRRSREASRRSRSSATRSTSTTGRTSSSRAGDVVVVGCKGYSDNATYIVDRAIKHRPDRPVVVMAESSPNGFLRRGLRGGRRRRDHAPPDA